MIRPTFLGVLAAAALAISACAGGPSPSSTAATDPAVSSSQPTASATTNGGAAGDTIQVTIATDTGVDLKFDPGELSVQPGADVQVTFENRSQVPHNLTFEAPINVASSAVVAPATTESLRFTAPGPGSYAFVCTIHSGMAGTLIVAAP
jgi:plastocyanin